MENEILNCGDVVILKSGGPVMTIQSMMSNTCECIWFDHSHNLFKETFVKITLNKYKEGPL